MSRLLSAFATGLILTGAAIATDPPIASVSGTGVMEIKRSAETLRVQLEVMARGKNLSEALDKLKIRREESAAALAKLGAVKDSVSFGDADMVDEASDRQGQMERMMMARNRALGKATKPKTETPTVVTVMVKADFPLPADKPEALLLAAKTLQEKIKAAELGGLKADEKVSPEAEEQAEEAVGGSNRGEMPRGTPAFLYVVKLTEAEKSKALAEAFELAKRDAARLAKAAGQSLGELQKLSDQSQPGIDPEDLQMMSQREYGYNRFGRGTSVIVGDEAMGMSPGKVVVKIGVVAQFRLNPGTK